MPMAKNIDKEKLFAKVLNSRFAQLIINEYIKKREFNIPIHLALGHEAFSEAVSVAMQDCDKLVCSHRNIHYQLARGSKLSDIIEEFKLSDTGLSRGKCGSMNLTNPQQSIIYTSNILGNNLCVGAGIALSNKIKQGDGVVMVVTGDGAIEEGAFYETLVNARSMDLPLIMLVENNDWSLASKITERRKPINLDQLALSIGARYTRLSSNNVMNYYQQIATIRNRVNLQKVPEIVEVGLTTLGGWMLQTEDFPDGKYVNYHSGLAPKVLLANGPVLNYDDSDPVYLIKESLGNEAFDRLTETTRQLFSSHLSV